MPSCIPKLILLQSGPSEERSTRARWRGEAALSAAETWEEEEDDDDTSTRRETGVEEVWHTEHVATLSVGYEGLARVETPRAVYGWMRRRLVDA